MFSIGSTGANYPLLIYLAVHVISPGPMTAKTAATAAPSETSSGADSNAAPFRQEPIPKPSEPMQFRAIGLVRGKYHPSEDQITKGSIITEDGATLDAVLLGRIMSLVKKHINLEDEHLWVVYPRTPERESSLHVQVVGVWEPETLQKEIFKEEEAQPSEDGLARPMRPKPPIKSTSDLEDGFFSVRGEVVYQSMEKESVVVKIKQAPRADGKSRGFKLNLKGKLGPKAAHHFWDLKVARKGDELVVTGGNCIGAIPQKRSPGRKGGGRRPGGSGGRRPGGRPGGSSRPQPRAGSSGGERRAPVPKPMKKKAAPAPEAAE